jgi:hypothetical protein
MKKLLVLPMMLATAGILGGTAVEAKSWVSGGNPGGRPGTIHRPKKRCTIKRPCSRMPEIPFLPGEVIPMPRGGIRPAR